jgi:hypothetical protein
MDLKCGRSIATKCVTIEFYVQLLLCFLSGNKIVNFSVFVVFQFLGDVSSIYKTVLTGNTDLLHERTLGTELILRGGNAYVQFTPLLKLLVVLTTVCLDEISDSHGGEYENCIFGMLRRVVW